MSNYAEQSEEIVNRFHSGKENRFGRDKGWVFEVREGDGNMGCSHRCDIVAEDAHEALILAHRHGFIVSPHDVRITKDIEGDSANATVASYVGMINGDSCRWVASASLAIDARNQ